MPRSVVLVVDDDAPHRRMLSEALESVGYETAQASNGEAAIEAVVAARPPDLVLLDIRMPGISGMQVLDRLTREAVKLPIIMLTAHGDVRTAVEAMKIGARDFIEKPIDIDELRAVVADILDRPAPGLDRGETSPEDSTLQGIVGVSDCMRQIRETVGLASFSSSTVLIRGESGTGKELVARAIHRLSARREGPFVAINCAAIAEGLLESEIFGHERGAFTGAEVRRKGRFEAADGGTIFLDEISEMQPRLQAKLLRVLQERSFERVGSSTTVEVDIRVVAATNRDIEHEVSAGTFREDLYFRLAVLEIVIPPLRERLEDVLPTANHLLSRLAGGTPPRLSDGVSTALLLHDWPGNVRELSNVLERGLLFAHGELAIEHLPHHLQKLCLPEEAVQSETGTPSTGVRPGISLKEVERDLIVKTLKAFEGNRTRTAEALGLSRRALLYKLKRYDIR